MTPDISNAALTLSGVALLITIANGAKKLFSSFKQPNDDDVAKLAKDGAVQGAQIFATKRELDEFKKDTKANMDKLETRLDTMRSDILNAGETRADVLHKRINLVLEAVSQVKGELNRIK